jgi:hypothetical protein
MARKTPEDRNAETETQGSNGPGYSARAETLRSEQIGVFEAMRWYWWLVVLCVVLLTGAGIGLALVRTPVYSSTATLNVDFAAQSPTTLQGSLSAAQASAESYARAFNSTVLINGVAKKTGLSSDTVLDRVSASAIPENTVVTVDAEGSSETAATKLANVSSNALIKYVAGFAQRGASGTVAESPKLLRRYRAVSADYNRYFTQQERLEKVAKLNPTPANTKAFEKAKLKSQVASLKREGLFQAYTESQRHYVAPLTYLARATSATDDQVAKLELLGFVGFAAGLAVGAALATLQANRTSAIA